MAYIEVNGLSKRYKSGDVVTIEPLIIHRMEAVKERFGGLDYVEKQLIDNGSYTRFKAGDILFCITPSNRGGYNVHTIPKDKNTHITRCDLPSSWGGLVNEELQKISGVDSATFCHVGLFLGACGMLNDAYKMARIAIDEKNN